jgi:hypothetical protein
VSGIQVSYFRVTSGLFYEVCSSFCAQRKEVETKINAFAEEVHAVPGRWVSKGWGVEGLYFGPMMPKGWRAMGKTLRGYGRPDTRTKLGKVYKERLEKFHQLTDEDLAAHLKLPPFFEELGVGTYCTAVGCQMRGGVFYIEVPSGFTNRFRLVGAEELTRTDYLKGLVPDA